MQSIETLKALANSRNDLSQRFQRWIQWFLVPRVVASSNPGLTLAKAFGLHLANAFGVHTGLRQRTPSAFKIATLRAANVVALAKTARQRLPFATD